MFIKTFFQYNTLTMPKKKKLLIVSISAGAGHTRAAEALEDAAKQEYPNIDAMHVNFFDYITPFAKRLIFDWFPWTMKHAPKIYGLSFLVSDNTPMLWVGRAINKLLYKKHGEKLVTLLTSHNPDYVLSTAPIISYSLGLVREKNNLNFKTGTVITDYYAHALWRHSANDTTYFASTKEVADDLVVHEVPRTKTIVSGIPVSGVWYEHKSIKELKEGLNINMPSPSVLILSGGYGFLNTTRVVQTLLKSNKSLTIIAACGKNKTQQSKLKNLSTPPHITLNVLGWVDNMDEYVRTADIIIARAGGLSSTECMVAKKHTILLDPIPGEGRKNAAYMQKQGHSIVARSHKYLLELIEKNTLQTLKPIPHTPKATKIILDTIQKEL